MSAPSPPRKGHLIIAWPRAPLPDGARVSKIVNVSGITTTTFYIGSHYEITSTGGQSAITKYYYFGAQRVAMRTSSGVTYLHSDHLGSTSATSGATVGTQSYYAFGKVRATTDIVPTD